MLTSILAEVQGNSMGKEHRILSTTDARTIKGYMKKEEKRRGEKREGKEGKKEKERKRNE